MSVVNAGTFCVSSAMCSVENNPAKRAKIAAAPVVDARQSNGFRGYSSIVYPSTEAFVSSPAPDFTAPGKNTAPVLLGRRMPPLPELLFVVSFLFRG